MGDTCCASDILDAMKIKIWFVVSLREAQDWQYSQSLWQCQRLLFRLLIATLTFLSEFYGYCNIVHSNGNCCRLICSSWGVNMNWYDTYPCQKNLILAIMKRSSGNPCGRYFRTSETRKE